MTSENSLICARLMAGRTLVRFPRRSAWRIGTMVSGPSPESDRRAFVRRRVRRRNRECAVGGNRGAVRKRTENAVCSLALTGHGVPGDSAKKSRRAKAISATAVVTVREP